jgi:hypothetical protein
MREIHHFIITYYLYFFIKKNHFLINTFVFYQNNLIIYIPNIFYTQIYILYYFKKNIRLNNSDSLTFDYI